jgi:hypothetical protein
LGKFLNVLSPSAPPTIYEELYPPNNAYGVSPISFEVTLKLTIESFIIPLSFNDQR